MRSGGKTIALAAITTLALGCHSSSSSNASANANAVACAVNDAGTSTTTTSRDAAAPPHDGAVASTCLSSLPQVLKSDGSIDAALYAHIAASLGLTDGIAFRYGPDANCIQGSGPTAPLVYAAPHRVCAGDGNPGYGSALTYEAGGTCDSTAGGYGSTQGMALFTADVLQGNGVDWLEISGFGFNVLSYRPMPSWTWGGYARAPFFGDMTIQATNGGPLSQPVAIGRSPGDEQTENDEAALIAFQDGLITTLGTNTGVGTFTTRLPAGLTPISIAVTQGSEFALILVWNTAMQESELAVYAMGSTNGLDTPSGGPYPGFWNGGAFTAGKLLGTVPLPGMKLATAVAANSNFWESGWVEADGSASTPSGSCSDFNLTIESQRQLLVAGGIDGDKRATAGFALVASKYEKLVAFVDLQPLYDYFNSKYLGSLSDFQETQNEGPADNQWPYTFAHVPAETPVVVTTITTTELPTAVYAGYIAPGRGAGAPAPVEALVGTIDGTLHQYTLGGLFDATAASASAIQEVSTFSAGRNPTSIIQSKHGVSEMAYTDVVVASRGDREIDFVSYATGKAALVQTVRDARMLDPIGIYDVTRSLNIVSVADYEGRRILNYHYGSWQNSGMGPVYASGPNGDGETDFGGAWPTAGGAFAISAANVP